ncbi:dethiobiotin synthase [Janthinobacterium agaricidamnosum]|uniref:ATP-dependent dethiobiotin synthetase BioD n=1 Tax=Janthinobacterium agaricidamnosum NBRC 102515 = DSM 9628 TaxID=1349767 RepID=W0V019_9BURK|nr:dethiobiotin synthase [Janthinobacterium agaricidamnosum]CDG80678.1 dethiobiotin synthase [Janthinobacterium agaricidamnosum NBRC 102515 = DSM 9628]
MSLEDPVIAPVTDTVAAAQAALAADGLPRPFACFVTGTDTEIGKTLTSSAMLHALVQAGVRACGMKPVAAGAVMRDGELHNDDADSLVAAGNVSMLRSLTTPYMLKEPAAPHIAAALEGISIDPVPILAAYLEVAAASDAVVVEGVGGFRVPLSDGYDTADLAQQLDLPVVMVVGLRLGCISQALLTYEAIAARGLTLAGWVANELEPEMRYADENIEALLLRLPGPLLGRVPRLADPSAEAAASYLNFTSLPHWPGSQ